MRSYSSRTLLSCIFEGGLDPTKKAVLLKSLHSLRLFGLVFFAIFSGCRPSAEEIFISKNDSGTSSLVYDCFIDMRSAPGQSPNNFNKKTIGFFFRNRKSQAVFEREISLSAAGIKPKIDWTEFPKIKISLVKTNGNVEMLYIVNVPSGDGAAMVDGMPPPEKAK